MVGCLFGIGRRTPGSRAMQGIGQAKSTVYSRTDNACMPLWSSWLSRDALPFDAGIPLAAKIWRRMITRCG